MERAASTAAGSEEEGGIMSAVYVVTRSATILCFEAVLSNKALCYMPQADSYEIFQRNCDCVPDCVLQGHKTHIGRVMKHEVVAIGFHEPLAVSGRLLTPGERMVINRLIEWLERKLARGYLPNKISSSVAALRALMAKSVI
jgi:hypothetical protein